MLEPTFIVGDVVVLVILAVVLHQGHRRWHLQQKNIIEQERSDLGRQADEVKRDAEARAKEALLEAKDQAYKLRTEVERENREQRTELQRLERRLAQKEETLDRRLDTAEKRERSVQQREAEIEKVHREVETIICQQREELRRVSGLSEDEARNVFLTTVEEESRHDAARLVREIEEEARREGERRARIIVTQAIQRCAVEQTSETTVSVVPLPNDDMKGRIIGREGRNIRAFETLTGVDLVIDDTPEAVVLSGFDPIRREVARLALTYLISDGRIHPGRIEETYRKALADVEARIQESGEQAVLETGLTGIAPEIVRLLGKMHFRTSFGQNVLTHSVEVSLLAALLAADVGADVQIARRAGLLHDLGKAVDHEVEGGHAVIGADLLRQYRERPDVIHAVEAHHNDVEPRTLEATLVMCADSISASRPGARRESIETYVKRVKRLEEIAQGFAGVDRCFAVQAGREVRLIVKPEMIDDFATIKLARDLAHRIEEDMEYPGQIKVMVIRETRAVDYAK